MSAYIAIRTYKLKPGVDRAAFEKAYEGVRPALGLQKVILLKGYQGDQRGVAKGAVDYVGLHIYESDEGCSRFVQPVYEGKDETAYPEELRPFIQAVGKAHRGETAESACYGYTVVHGAV